MKTCPKCSVEHNKPGTFCSRSCANTRSHDKSVYEKMAKALAKTRVERGSTQKQIDHMRKIARQRHLDVKERIKALPFKEWPKHYIKEKLFNEQHGKCLHCHLSVWMGEPIPLELDHVDGDNKNNARENVRLLCPNCHAKTPTWRRGWKLVRPAGIEPAFTV